MQKRNNRNGRNTDRKQKKRYTPLACDYSCDAESLGVCKECLEWAKISGQAQTEAPRKWILSAVRERSQADEQE